MMKIPLFRVNQWLDSWEPIQNKTDELGLVPRYFYLASISLLKLRQLAGVHYRDKAVRKTQSKNAGYQRPLDQTRTRQISRFIGAGFPLSSTPSLDPSDFTDLIHPGWLPTSILVNVLREGDKRRRGGEQLVVPKDKLLHFENNGNGDFLVIPDELFTLEPTNDLPQLQPIEIIDGQHRVFAVDKFENFPDSYQVPVVIFDGLSESWQAYLFWVINVEPKRINTSLAFDLYPELRSQDWLERGETTKIYQEHRAQELTEIMWRHEKSVWRDRIELLGNRVSGHVSNASFIRSLTTSFVKKWTAPDKIGGLFGSIDKNNKILPWKRAQQAAFLIYCWQTLSEELTKAKVNWTLKLDGENPDENLPLALTSGKSLLSTDQGVRTIHYLFNLFCVKNYKNLELEKWYMPDISETPEEETINEALSELSRNEKISSFLQDLSKALIQNLDWRTSNAPGLSQNEQQQQSAYRGSAGYSLLRKRALEALSKSNNPEILAITNQLNADKS